MTNMKLNYQLLIYFVFNFYYVILYTARILSISVFKFIVNEEVCTFYVDHE